MTIHFIINPTAGLGRGRRVWASLESHLSALSNKARWYFSWTSRPGDATRLARDAVAAGCERIVAVGGDGTVSEVLAGTLGSGVDLAVVPGGTGNDYCRGTGIPLDPRGAAELAVHGAAQPVDVGEVVIGDSKRHFVNVASLGLDAEVARRANRYPKLFGGTVPYLLAAVPALARYRPVPTTIEIEGQRIQKNLTLTAVASAPFYGGGIKIAPQAHFTDGRFDVCIAADLSRTEMLAILPKLHAGGHVGHPKVTFLRCREIAFIPDGSLPIQADGEILGAAPARFRALPGAVNLVTPQAETARRRHPA